MFEAIVVVVGVVVVVRRRRRRRSLFTINGAGSCNSPRRPWSDSERRSREAPISIMLEVVAVIVVVVVVAAWG